MRSNEIKVSEGKRNEWMNENENGNENIVNRD
jgi:hypothetical protein